MRIPCIHTDSITLRPFEPDDFEILEGLFSDSAAMKHMHFRHWGSREIQDWLKRVVDETHNEHPNSWEWAVELRQSNEVVGWLGIGRPATMEIEAETSFAYALLPQYWGRGIMTKAVRALFDYQFGVVGIHALNASCHIANAASSRVLEKSGMSYVGMRDHKGVDGYTSPQRFYRLAKDEWCEKHTS